MSTLADLLVRLTLDSAGFTGGVDEAVKKTHSFSSGLMSGVKNVAKFGVETIKYASMAATAIGGATVAVTKFAAAGGELVNIKNAFEEVALTGQWTGKEVLDMFKKFSGGMISNTEAMKSYSLAAQLVSVDFADTLPDAMGYMTKVAAATGQDIGYLMDSYVRGVGRLSPMILDNLGIQVDLTQAYEDFAQANGLVAGSLDKTQQQMAVADFVQKRLAENTAAMPDVIGTNAQKWASFTTSIKDAKDQVQMMLSEAFTPLFDALTTFADDAIPKVIESITPFLSTFGEMAAMFVSGDIEGGVKKFGEIVDTIISTIVDKLPGFIDTGFKIIQAIVTAVLSNLPKLVPVALMLVTSFVTFILQNLPNLLETGMQMIASLLTGIGQALPAMIPMIVETIANLAMTFINNLPMMVDAGIQLILGLADGLINAIPIIVTKGPEVILGLVTGVVQAIPKIIAAGATIITGLVNAIIENLPLLITNMVAVITAITQSISENLPLIIPAAIEIVLAIVMGIIKALPIIAKAAPDIIKALGGGIKNLASTLWDIGKNIITGIWEGIKNNWAEIKKSILDLFSGLWDGVKAFFGVSSPSKLFMELGEQLNKGFALGVRATIDLPNKELDGYSIPAVGGSATPYSQSPTDMNEYIVSLLQTLPDTISKSMRDNLMLAVNPQ